MPLVDEEWVKVECARLLAAAWAVVALQMRTSRVRDPNRVEVPSSVAARAVGCAQCAPVAVIDNPGRQIRTSANDSSTARDP
jgi:hypothetical protein